MTTEEIQERLRDLRALYRDGLLSPQTLTIQLYGLYVEVVQEIAEPGGVADPQGLCRALIQGVAEIFPDRPWVPWPSADAPDRSASPARVSDSRPFAAVSLRIGHRRQASGPRIALTGRDRSAQAEGLE